MSKFTDTLKRIFKKSKDELTPRRDYITDKDGFLREFTYCIDKAISDLKLKGVFAHANFSYDILSSYKVCKRGQTKSIYSEMNISYLKDRKNLSNMLQYMKEISNGRIDFTKKKGGW